MLHRQQQHSPPQYPGRRNIQQYHSPLAPRANGIKASSFKKDSYVESNGNAREIPRRTTGSRMFSLPQLAYEPPSQRHYEPDIHPVGPTQSYSLPHELSNGVARYNPNEWRNWAEATVKVTNLPSGITPMRLQERFREVGNISDIEIREDDQQGTTGRVTFCPPPAEPIWQGHEFRFSSQKSEQIIGTSQVELEAPKGIFEHISPVNPLRTFPERMTLYATLLQFGIMFQEDTMMVMKEIQGFPKYPISFVVNLPRRELTVGFSMHMHETNPSTDGSSNAIKPDPIKTYKFTIPFQHLQKIWDLNPNYNHREFVIPLSGPPQFFRRLGDWQRTHDNGKIWNDWRLWARQTDIVSDHRALDSTPLNLHKAPQVIDIGAWTTFKLTFESPRNFESLFEKIRQALQDYNVNFLAQNSFKVIPKRELSFWNWIDGPKHSSPRTLLDIMSVDISPLPFNVRYQLEVCLSQGILHECNIGQDFLRRLSSLPPNRAQSLLEHVAERKKRIFDPIQIFDAVIPATISRRAIPPYCVLTRSVTVTPSTIYYNTPNVEISNRIIRQYSEHADRFLRVKFADEKHEGRIHPCDDNSQDAVFSRVYRCLKHGIVVGDINYQFLAMSNSQFREHGAYFFAETGYLTADTIRKEMGIFNDIKTVGKFASRIGQCFSTTRATSMKGKLVEMEDTERNGYNFTDGIGKLSMFLAQNAAIELGLPTPSDDPPSLFQFRLGGCKGVLAVDPKINPFQIHIRRSQYKFPAQQNGLEIIRYSAFANATLNRQLLMVLVSLGVSHEVVYTKFDNMLDELSRAMTDVKLALKLLQRQVDFNQTTLVIASILLDGFLQAGDPFVKSVLNLWRAWILKLLKEKAGLVLEKSAFLFGCVDETGTLRGHFNDSIPHPDLPLDQRLAALPEIFVQITSPADNGQSRIIKGICAVARNPSLHPGDIRVVRAVDVTALHYLKNVVVFPQTGDRDIPNMCSGGDLDGDDFVVIWDQDFIPKEWDYPAMDFPPAETKDLDRDVEIDDIRKFFVNYMRSDKLGAIATAHLANADLSPEGVKSDKCIELARLHSLAVDFPKSGVTVKMQPELRPHKYPHYMPRRSKEANYHSTNILGQLYDKVETIDFEPLLDNPFDERVLNAFDEDLPVKMIQRAKEVKDEYDTAMRRIMAQHEIGTEFEVWTGFVMKHSNLMRDYPFQEEIGRTSNALKDKFRKMCIGEAGGREPEVLGQFVTAMYIVTARDVQDGIRSRSGQSPDQYGSDLATQAVKLPLISFPWLFPRELGQIATKGQNSHLHNLKAQQGPTKRQLKRTTNTGAGESELNMETARGIAREGDLLELFPEDPDRLAHIQMVEDAITMPPADPCETENLTSTNPDKRDGGHPGNCHKQSLLDDEGNFKSTIQMGPYVAGGVMKEEKDEEEEFVTIEEDDGPSAMKKLEDWFD